MDRIKKKLIDTYYYNDSNVLKKTAIYCHQIDRFIISDDYDVWITFKTAKILSSKIASTVFILPKVDEEFNNETCISYSILNKTSHTRTNAPELITNQYPTLRHLHINENNGIIRMDIPEDYKNPEGVQSLIKLKNYANFVNKYAYATEFVNALNSLDNKIVPETFFPKEWNEILFSYESLHSDKSLCNQIDDILFFANSEEEAKLLITKAFDEALRVKAITLQQIDWFFNLADDQNPFKGLL